MSMFQAYDGAHFVSSITKLSYDRGVHIRIGTDFEEYTALIHKHRQQQPPAPPFNPAFHDFTDSPSFWSVGTDTYGDVVFTQAMRYIDLGAQTLAQYLTDKFLEFPPVTVPVDLGKSAYLPGPGAHRITGRTFYHGDVWMRGGDSPYRGTGLPNVLARLAMVTALMRASPDHIFGFIARGQAFRGLGEREGYMHSDPSALHWRRADKPETIVCQMVWMAKEDLEFLLNVQPEGVMAA